jgi:hypothetical protein
MGTLVVAFRVSPARSLAQCGEASTSTSGLALRDERALESRGGEEMDIEADPTRRTEAESGASEETDREREVGRGSTGQLVARHDIYIYTHT